MSGWGYAVEFEAGTLAVVETRAGAAALCAIGNRHEAMGSDQWRVNPVRHTATSSLTPFRWSAGTARREA